jgi:threonine/homoserine/homoserine lactone efflux protein
MDHVALLVAFTLAAALLTITPGLDTALVLRTALTEGRRGAAFAAAGICAGLLAWGAAVAVGLGALMAASALAYDILRWCGAAYLIWLGASLILRPRASFALGGAAPARPQGTRWLRVGFLSNLLNPKVGAFYVSFLPQFTPEGAGVSWTMTLAAIHAAEGVLWFALLIFATQPLRALFQRPDVVRWLDRATGGAFIAFGAGLALARRQSPAL